MRVPIKPEIGQVIRYGYVWHREAQEGQENGRKDRPCAVVLTVEGEESEITTLVVPITHTQPDKGTAAVPIPLKTAQRLGLDGQQSWVVVSELNSFVWPGYDLAEVGDTGSPIYGLLPPALYELIKAKALEEIKAKRAIRTAR